MILEEINDIQQRLENDEYPSEAAVSSGIVRKLLDALGWPVYSTQVVFPEYSVESRRVDFALCHPPSKPIVFIEVKQRGKIDGAERQLFEYAFHEGVPIAVLTDGQEWRFFSPGGQGDYKERKVYEMDLLNNNSEDSAERLNRYLNYRAVQSGKARQAIIEDYEKVYRIRQIDRYLPKAWDELTEGLFDLVAEKTEELSQYKPTHEEILAFVKNLDGKTETLGEKKASPAKQFPSSGSEGKPKAPATGFIVTMPGGEMINHRVAANTFAEAIERLGVERVKNLDVIVSGIPLIATFDHHLYDQRQAGGYYIMVHLSNKKKKQLLERIAKELGENLKVEIVPKKP